MDTTTLPCTGICILGAHMGNSAGIAESCAKILRMPAVDENMINACFRKKRMFT